MKLITISGLDGSGKSTQIDLLKKFLKLKGKSFYYFHAIEFSIANKGTKSQIGDLVPKKGVTKANWSQIQLRKIALLVDIFRFRQLVKKEKVDYIISDRYFYDSVVNILYLIGNLDIRCLRKKIFTEKFIPRPDIAFFIDINPEIIMRRERKPDQGREYLAAKEKLYAEKIKDWKINIIDGERNKDEIFEDIKSKIQSLNIKSNSN